MHGLTVTLKQVVQSIDKELKSRVMSKVHITLVGGQPAPVYHGIVATKPDIVVFIYSRESMNILDKLKNEISIDIDEQEPLDATDPKLILDRANSLAQKYKDDEVTVNISSGLKSWSHLFGIVFDKMPNADVVYMDQNNVLWNYHSMTKQEDFEFNMHTLFRLYGNSLENNYWKFEDYTDADFQAVSEIEKIRMWNVKDFNALTAVLDKTKQNILSSAISGKFNLLKAKKPSMSYVEWEKTTANSVGFVRLSLFKKEVCHEIVLESPHIVNLVFNSGWFEYKVAHLLSYWNKSKEICLNCRFPFRQGIDKNETDIIVNTGTKLLFVECKTQITHPTDIDKFRSVVKGYGGTGSKGLFVTDAKMTAVAKQKCDENDILTFSLQDEHLGLSTSDALILLLESELFNINAK